jgi:hypothetical protein
MRFAFALPGLVSSLELLYTDALIKAIYGQFS